MKIHPKYIDVLNRWIGAYAITQMMAELKLKIILQQEKT